MFIFIKQTDFSSFTNWPKAKYQTYLYTLLKTSDVLKDNQSKYFYQFAVLKCQKHHDKMKDGTLLQRRLCHTAVSLSSISYENVIPL